MLFCAISLSVFSFTLGHHHSRNDQEYKQLRQVTASNAPFLLGALDFIKGERLYVPACPEPFRTFFSALAKNSAVAGGLIKLPSLVRPTLETIAGGGVLSAAGLARWIVELRTEPVSPELEKLLRADWVQAFPDLPCVREGRVAVAFHEAALIPGPRLDEVVAELARAIARATR